MVREVSFTDSEQTRNRSHQFIVNPQTTHRVVQCRINHHRSFVWIVVGNFFVHVEQVTIFSFYNIFTQTVDGVGEVEEHGQTCVVHTEAGVATFFSGT